MKISQKYLKNIILEEIRSIKEGSSFDPSKDPGSTLSPEEQERNRQRIFAGSDEEEPHSRATDKEPDKVIDPKEAESRRRIHSGLSSMATKWPDARMEVEALIKKLKDIGVITNDF